MNNDTTPEASGAVAGPLQRPVGRQVPERAGNGTLYRWLVEEFDANGNSAGRFMLCGCDLTTTSNVHEARRYLGMRTAMFRAEEMREKYGGDWRHVHHGFMLADRMTPNAAHNRPPSGGPG